MADVFGEPSGRHAAANCADLLQRATQRLAAALGLQRREARIEARALCARALGVDPAWLLAHDLEPLDPARARAVEALIARRERGEPVAYITGTREFHGRAFQVDADVLIPRSDTELLVETALRLCPADAPLRVLDVGTGSGAVAITLALERPRWRVSALDVCARALARARANAERLGATVTLLHSDLFAALADATFDLIVSNPPYIAEDDPHLLKGDLRFEPALALASGANGLDLIERMIADAPARLADGGRLLMEHGWNQSEAIRARLSAAGYQDIATHLDLAGRARVTGGRIAPGAAVSRQRRERVS